MIERSVAHAGENRAIWQSPVLQTIALDSTGVLQVLEAIAAHRDYLHSSGLWSCRERARFEMELRNVLQQELLDRLMARVEDGQLWAWVDRIVARGADVGTAAQSLLGK